MYATAFLDLPPLRHANGRVRLPGSKSISNRVLLLAALCEGRTRIHELLASDDTEVMLQALETLGCGVTRHASDEVSIDGLGGRLQTRDAALFLGNAGTAMRPLTAALALLASTQGASFELSGVARMHERPIADLADALRALGCPVQHLSQAGYPPLRVGDGQAHALRLDAPIAVRGDVSSQFLTALLMSLPLVAERDVHIEVVGELISKPYIAITLGMLERFGIEVRHEQWQRFTISAGSRYQSPGDIHVEGDASSASYFIALGAIAASDGREVCVQGLGLNALQGDIRFVDAARAMGAHIDGNDHELRVRRGAWPLRAIDMDCNHIPDAAMTLAAMALYADGPSTLRNIASWRVKETDRLHAMATELRKVGAQVDEGADWLRITPPQRWQRARIATYDDHRMAMCLSLAAFNPDQQSLRIEDPKCVAKTFPDYFETLFDLVEAPQVPVLCIDGPTASGKGSLSRATAAALGYHWLDSGALYRVLGLAAEQAGLSTEAQDLAQAGAAQKVAACCQAWDLRFDGEQVWLNGQDVTQAVRSAEGGQRASRISIHPEVRAALLQAQHDFARLPGLVADGRDMGTVVFPEAPLKVFLTASAEARAQRRHKQLISLGISANIDDLLLDLQARDARDQNRSASPLQPASDARLLDNTSMDIDTSCQQVLAWWSAQLGFDTTE
jgi:3-phosphoshikimate 1-carboxyvinyltransferase